MLLVVHKGSGGKCVGRDDYMVGGRNIIIDIPGNERGETSPGAVQNVVVLSGCGGWWMTLPLEIGWKINGRPLERKILRVSLRSPMTKIWGWMVPVMIESNRGRNQIIRSLTDIFGLTKSNHETI